MIRLTVFLCEEISVQINWRRVPSSNSNLSWALQIWIVHERSRCEGNSVVSAQDHKCCCSCRLWMLLLCGGNLFDCDSPFCVCFKKIKTTMHTCPTLKWIQTSGVRKPERRNVLRWRFCQTFWKSIMGINSSFLTGTWSQLEVSCIRCKVCVSVCKRVCVCSAASSPYRMLHVYFQHHFSCQVPFVW